MAKSHALCALLPLCACTIYTLPELDTASSGFGGDTGAITESFPTTGELGDGPPDIDAESAQVIVRWILAGASAD